MSTRTEFGQKAGLTLNRVAVLLTALAALAAALAPVLADLDWESTAGIIAGISSITAIVYKWLDGWQKWEGRHDPLRPDPEAIGDVAPPVALKPETLPADTPVGSPPSATQLPSKPPPFDQEA